MLKESNKMELRLKRFALTFIIICISVSLFSVIYAMQVERNCKSNIELLTDNNKLLKENNEHLKNNISILQEQKDFYQNKYYDYLEYSIELEQQMGIYNDYY